MNIKSKPTGFLWEIVHAKWKTYIFTFFFLKNYPTELNFANND